jgi:hypothetical protein
MAYDPTKHAGAGLEDLDKSSKMPLLNIIQQMSPQINPKKDQFIEGSKAGDIFFAPTSEILDQPIDFLPVALKTVYVEWKPLDQGGGIVGIHPLDIRNRKDLGYQQGRKTQYDEWLGSNELKKTTYVMGLILLEGEQTDAMLALTSTGQRVARKLQDDINKFRYDGDFKAVQPAVFARAFNLTAEYEENKNGDGYFNWKLSNPRVLDFVADEALLTLAASKNADAQAALPSPQATAATTLIEASDADIF